MLAENEIKKMIYPTADKLMLKPPIYLIHNIDNDNYLIHRELKQDEESSYPNHETYMYENKKYLFGVVNAPSEDNAILAVESYWRAFELFNTIK